jgi:hypothetical protein
MLQMAQDVFKMLRDRVGTTLRAVADIAEAMGVPPTLTSLIAKREAQGEDPSEPWPEASSRREGPDPDFRRREDRVAGPSHTSSHEGPCTCDSIENAGDDEDERALDEQDTRLAQTDLELSEGNGSRDAPYRKRVTGKRRGLVGEKDLSSVVRPLEVDDAVNGSTYLARIIWSLGVAHLEGIGPLRPADMARMIMSRSAVSLEPPNVARYIRRSKPREIEIDRVDGGSNFYRLNDHGQAAFEEKFRIDKQK